MNQSNQTMLLQLAKQIANQYSQLPQITAVALGGSLATQQAESGSDIDLYVYGCEAIPLEARRAIAEANASHAEVNNQFWESGDEWIDAETNIHVDVMFRSPQWIEDVLDRVLVQHQASVGYSTCFWHNVLTSKLLFDRDGWYGKLQKWAERPYPPQLQQNIIAKNYPILRNTLSSYLYQINSALRRKDTVSLNHRIAALLASYFDIIFALNQLPHPGEKRIMHLVNAQCPIKPENMEEQVNALLTASIEDQNHIEKVNALIDGLENIVPNQ